MTQDLVFDTSKPVVRPMVGSDLKAASEVHQAAFIRQTRSLAWLECNLNAFPRMMSYVAASATDCLGYIIWTQKSGFRPEVVMELEQMAVSPDHQRKGIGRLLIEESLPQVRAELYKQGSLLKHIVVTTRADNHAQRLYRSALGAEVEADINDLYSADEVIMVARNL